MEKTGLINLMVMDIDHVIFNDKASSIFIQGDRGEYELLPHHYPVMGLLRQGQIAIDWKKYIDVKSGIIRFFKNECVILVEPDL